MCGRWYVDLMSDVELKEFYSKLKNKKKKVKEKGEVFPSDQVMVIANDKKKKPGVFSMKWGYTIGKNLVFNAREESLETKPLFIDGIKNRRCVIPANYYYEWDKLTKEKNEIKTTNNEIMYFLGIYRFENNEPVCTIITKEASKNMEPLHPRMPVIIKKDKIDDWLKDRNNVSEIILNSLTNLEYRPSVD